MVKLYVVYKNGEYLEDTYVYSTYNKDKASKVAEIEGCCTVHKFVSEYDVENIESSERYEEEINKLKIVVRKSNEAIAHNARVQIVQHQKIKELERKLGEV